MLLQFPPGGLLCNGDTTVIMQKLDISTRGHNHGKIYGCDHLALENRNSMAKDPVAMEITSCRGSSKDAAFMLPGDRIVSSLVLLLCPITVH